MRRFEVLRLLGEGGMGIVYEALDHERGVRVALKTLRTSVPEGLARFKREFRALEGIHHENLVRLGELIHEDDQWYFTMELVEGVDFLAYVRPWYRVASSAPSHPTHGRRDRSTLLDLDTEEREEPPPSSRAAQVRTERDAPRFDETRLRAAIRGLARGLIALHEAHRVHRDVKPSNIRVAKDGRVVLLDFGLVGELEIGPHDDAIAGTPVYMAPEQARDHAMTPAVDWYAAGVVLFQALTGRLPFEGSARLVLEKKQWAAPPAPSALVHDVPYDLEHLCMALLEPDPAMRPAGHDVLGLLRASSAPPAIASSGRWSIPPSAMPPPLRPSGTAPRAVVGREAELAMLHDAFEASESKGVTVLVDGDSGIGKTCLVRAFTERVSREYDGLLVLHGRCHERETVPYKALDDVVDILCRRLAQMPSEALEEIIPAHVETLLSVFPVLSRLTPFATEAARIPESGDMPRELRRRAFGAFRELFTRIARRHRLIVVVDDLHWADADSLALLDALLRPQAGPPLLFIGTARSAAEMAADAHDPRALAVALPGDVRVLHVGPLAEEDARTLAARALATDGAVSDTLVSTIAVEASGHPLFIDELAVHVTAGGDLSALRLDDALGARIAQLDARARCVSELVSLALSPLRQDALARAASMGAEDLASVVSLLRASNIVRTSGGRPQDRIEPYHERVRAAVLARLEIDARRTHHAALAKALAEVKPLDAEALAAHWREAGDPTRAAKFAAMAAREAWSALAFDRAAEQYRAAIALGGAEAHSLRVQLADALADGGRGAVAAEAYREAAEEATDPLEQHELRRLAAEQLYRCGRPDEGLAAAKAVLAPLGLRVPSTLFGALVRLVFWRALLSIRSFRVASPDPSRLSARTLMRIDACSLLASYGSTATLVGPLFSARALWLALRAGDARRVAIALANQLVMVAIRGTKSWRTTSLLMQHANAMAMMADSPRVVAWVTALSGFAHFTAGRFRRALTLLTRGEEMLLRQGSRGFEIQRAQLYGISALFLLGELKEACARLPVLLEDARERGDGYAEVNLRIGYPSLAWLAQDDAERAQREIDAASAKIASSHFDIAHHYELFARVNLALYLGDARAALRLVEDGRHRYSRSFLDRSENVRIRTLQMRARCALAMASVDASVRDGALRDAESMARRLAREVAEWATPTALAIRGGAAVVRGDRIRAVEILRAAVSSFDSADLALDAAVARYALGTAMGGAQGAAMRAQCTEWMAGQGIVKPERMVRVFAPWLEMPANPLE